MRGSAAERGFALLEALVALLLLGTVIAASLGAFAGGLRAEAGLDRHLTAVALAEHRLTELSLLPRDSLAAYGTIRAATFAAPFDDFRWSALVRPAPDHADLYRAAVRITWNDGAFSLETMFYRPDPLPAALRSGP
ncbi:MAG TPA: hypothetical protein VF188_03435 [Longimicrobiales bacterium]